MVADGDCFPPPRLTEETPLDPEVQSGVDGIKSILEREIEFLQRQIKARGMGMNKVDLAELEVMLRPLLLDAVERSAGHK